MTAALAEPVQAPVAWLRLRDGKLASNDGGNFGNDWMPLYTAPPQRTLTDEVIAELWYKNGTYYHHFARAIERWLKGEQ